MSITVSTPINPGEKHIAVVLLVDTSTSMMEKPIEELNMGLQEFGKALKMDSLAMGRAEVCIVSFNDTVQVEHEFRPATEYIPPKLCAGGLTCLNEAINVSLDILEERKRLYNEIGIDYYRPWLFVLTDGSPTDVEKEEQTVLRLKKAIGENKVVYMPMGIGENAKIEKLQAYYPDDVAKKIVLKADADNFKEAFVWLSRSVSAILESEPKPNSSVLLPPTPSIISVGV